MLTLISPSRLIRILGITGPEAQELKKKNVVPIHEHLRDGKPFLAAEISDIILENARQYPEQIITTESKPISFFSPRRFIDYIRKQYELEITGTDIRDLKDSEHAEFTDISINDRVNKYLIIPDEEKAFEFLFDRTELKPAWEYLNKEIGQNPEISKEMFLQLIKRGVIDKDKLKNSYKCLDEIQTDLISMHNIFKFDKTKGTRSIALYSRRSIAEALKTRFCGLNVPKQIKTLLDTIYEGFNYFWPEDFETINRILSETKKTLIKSKETTEISKTEGGIRTDLMKKEPDSKKFYTCLAVGRELVKRELLTRLAGRELEKPVPAFINDLEYNPSLSFRCKSNPNGTLTVHGKQELNNYILGIWYYHYKDYLENQGCLPDREYQIRVQTFTHLIKSLVREKKRIYVNNYERAKQIILAQNEIAIDISLMYGILGRTLLNTTNEKTIYAKIKNPRFSIPEDSKLKIKKEEKNISLTETIQQLKGDNPGLDLENMLSQIIAVLKDYGDIPEYLVYQIMTGKNCEYIRPIPKAKKTLHFATVYFNDKPELINVTNNIGPKYLENRCSQLIESHMDEVNRVFYNFSEGESTMILKIKRLRNR